MRNPVVQLLAILGLMAAAGTAYNLANWGNSQKYLPWDGSKIYGKAATTVQVPPPQDPPPVEEKKGPTPPTGPGETETAAPGGSGPSPREETKPGATPQAPDEFRRIALKETLEELEHEPTFIDARRTREYEAGHIPGALSICPYEQADFLDKINKLHAGANLEAPIVIYCTNSNECESSKMVARQLKDVGFLDIMIYLGGFPEWQKEKPNLIATGKEPGKKSP